MSIRRNGPLPHLWWLAINDCLVWLPDDNRLYCETVTTVSSRGLGVIFTRETGQTEGRNSEQKSSGCTGCNDENSLHRKRNVQIERIVRELVGLSVHLCMRRLTSGVTSRLISQSVSGYVNRYKRKRVGGAGTK